MMRYMLSQLVIREKKNAKMDLWTFTEWPKADKRGEIFEKSMKIASFDFQNAKSLTFKIGRSRSKLKWL